MLGMCRGSACAAWAYGPDRYIGDVDPYAEELATYTALNPPPTDEAEIPAYRKAAAAYASSLPPTAPPSPSGWTWRAGYDDEALKPFACWSKQPIKVGYCADRQLGPALEEIARKLGDNAE